MHHSYSNTKGKSSLFALLLSLGTQAAMAGVPFTLPFTETFNSVTVGTESATNESLTFNGVVYSTDATGDKLHVGTIADVTGNLTSIGTTGNGLSGVWYGTNTGTYLKFATEVNTNNFQLKSFNAEVFNHQSQNSEVYTLQGYDDGVLKATATVNFTLSGTYGSGANTVTYTRTTIKSEEYASNAGGFTFTGSAWGNIDEVRIVVADKAPNTIFTVAIDDISFGTAVFTTDLAIAPAASFSFYPNPASDVLQIVLPQEINGTVSIMDLKGEVVMSQALAGSKSTLSTASLASGVYVIKIGDDTFSRTKQAVIVR